MLCTLCSSCHKMDKKYRMLSLDSEVLILLLYYWSKLKSLWIKTAVGDTSRYVPVHGLADKIGWGLLSSFACCAYFDGT